VFLFNIRTFTNVLSFFFYRNGPFGTLLEVISRGKGSIIIALIEEIEERLLTFFFFIFYRNGPSGHGS
jgi:hypothetical protein